MTNSSTIQVRRADAATAANNNPTLAAGEIGFETDTGKFKIGDGSTAWTSLAYSNDLSLLPESVQEVTRAYQSGSIGSGGATFAVQLDPPSGGDDTSMIQSKISQASAMSARTATGYVSVVPAAPGSLYQLKYNTAIAGGNASGQQPWTGAAMYTALIMESGVILDCVSFQSPDYEVRDGANFGYSAICAPSGTNNWRVKNCSFDGSATTADVDELFHQAIFAGWVTDVQLDNNVSQNFRQSFCDFMSAPDGSGTTQRVWVRGNKISRHCGGAIKFDNGAQDIWVLDNVCYDNLEVVSNPSTAGGAEVIFFDDPSNTNVWVCRNSCQGWGTLAIEGGTNIFVEHNFVSIPAAGDGAAFRCCVAPTSVSVTDNVFDATAPNDSGQSWPAVALFGTDDSTPINVTFARNRVLASTAMTGGVLIRSVQQTSQGQVVIIDNEIVSSATANSHLETFNVANPIIRGNRITCEDGGSDNGINMIDNAGTAMVTENYVVGCSILTSGATPVLVANNNVVAGEANSALIAGAAGTYTGNTFSSALSYTPGGVVQVGCSNSMFSNNTLITTQAGLVGFAEQTGASANLFLDNTMRLDNGTPITFAAHSTSVARNNNPFNPVGAVPVTIPASGRAMAAANYDRTFYVTSGTGGCAMTLQNGPTINVPSGTVATIRVPGGITVTPVFTAAPTWVVQGE